MSEVEVSFPGGQRVDARIGTHTIHTDQSVAADGQDTAPNPFDLFLASLAACGGHYVLAFCRRRGISVKGMRMLQHSRSDEQGHLEQVELEIILPSDFPAKYREAIALSAESCRVRTTLSTPPTVLVRSRFADESRPQAAS